MDLLIKVNEWVQKGYEIKYWIVNQNENGYLEEVLRGKMPAFTYTFNIDNEEEEIWSNSVNSLEEGFSLAIKWLEENRK